MNDAIGKVLLAWRIRVVEPHIRGRLLDIGCGTNQLVRSYSGDGLGVDVYPWEGIDLLVEDTADLPFDDGEFDTITIVAALNHIPNREEVLREVYRLLKPEGRLIITMIPPGISRIWHKIREPWDADQSHRGMKPGEVFGLTEADIRGLFETVGFEVTFRKGFMLNINRLFVAQIRPPKGI